MTWLRALLMLSAFFVSVQSFPSPTWVNDTESTSELELKNTTDPLDPQAILDNQTDLDTGSSTIEFVFKGPTEGLNIQNGSVNDKYTISNLPTENEAEKKNLLDTSKDNEIDTFGKGELYRLNITDLSKNEHVLETQIKSDQWLFNPQEMSSITGGGLPKYFYDATKSIYPFPELSEIVKGVSTNSKTMNVNFRAPIAEKSDQPPHRSGPLLYPQSVFSREIDIPFYY